MRYVVFAMLFVLGATIVEAQLFTQRTNFIRNVKDTTTIGEAFGSTSYSIEFARGFNSLGDEQAWNGKFFGAVDLYRWNSTAVLRGLFSSELSCNPHNDISFNPRAIIWEQAIAMHIGGLSFALQHRCKHDVDNSDSTHGDTPSIYSVKKRVLINTGASVTWVQRKVSSSLSIDYAVRGEAYLYNSDYRFPANDSGRSYKDIRGSVMGAMRCDYQLALLHSVFARAWGSAIAFGASTNTTSGFEINARVEGGYHLRGKQAGMDVFVSWERIFDETAFTIPAPTTCVSVGVRLGSSLFF